MPRANATDFDVTCEKCGAIYHTSEQSIGGYIKCRASGCDGHILIRRDASSALECAIAESRAAQPQVPGPTTAQQCILSESVLRVLRLTSASCLFVVLALLLSKLFLVAGGRWLPLSRRGLLFANINAGILIALGFACASWLVVSWAAYRRAVSNTVTDRLRSVWAAAVAVKSAIRSMRRGRKVSWALATCCGLLAAFWLYRSTHANPESAVQSGDWKVVEEIDLDSFMQQQRSADAAKRNAEEHNNPSKRVTPAGERPTAYRTQPSGTRITSDLGTDGHGQLKVSNGTSVDAVVRLYDTATDRTIRWFWVQSGGSAQIGEIPQGSYSLAYTTGLDWLEEEDAFRWHPSYSEFDKQLRYAEERDGEGIQYRTISITLNPVVGGNVRTHPISRDHFLRGHSHKPVER